MIKKKVKRYQRTDGRLDGPTYRRTYQLKTIVGATCVCYVRGCHILDRQRGKGPALYKFNLASIKGVMLGHTTHIIFSFFFRFCFLVFLERYLVPRVILGTRLHVHLLTKTYLYGRGPCQPPLHEGSWVSPLVILFYAEIE